MISRRQVLKSCAVISFTGIPIFAGNPKEQVIQSTDFKVVLSEVHAYRDGTKGKPIREVWAHIHDGTESLWSYGEPIAIDMQDTRSFKKFFNKRTRERFVKELNRTLTKDYEIEKHSLGMYRKCLIPESQRNYRFFLEANTNDVPHMEFMALNRIKTSLPIRCEL